MAAEKEVDVAACWLPVRRKLGLDTLVTLVFFLAEATEAEQLGDDNEYEGARDNSSSSWDCWPIILLHHRGLCLYWHVRLDMVSSKRDVCAEEVIRSLWSGTISITP